MPDLDLWIALAIFIAAYTLIAVERFDRTLVALLGGLLAVALGILDQHAAFEAIDLNVIFLLAGMMVIASTLAKTGFFEWVAVRSVRLSHGEPMRLLVILCIVTAVLSAFLDNVTTVLLTTPVTLSVARRLRVPPAPYLIAQILASNIGGTATLIGDPPNILIGSAAGLDFVDFLLNLAPVTVVIFGVFLVTMRIVFRNALKVPEADREAALEASVGGTITDRPLLIRSLVVLGVTLIGFLTHSALGLEAATVALLGATVLMLVSKIDPHIALREVEWSTLFFFVGLFILVESLVAVGVIASIAEGVAELTAGDTAVTSVALLWFSAIASAIVDNIPYTASAIPVVHELVANAPSEALWWALALGACLGGNLTIVGASANVVAAGIAARAGHPIRFMSFFGYGAIVVVESLAISTAYVWLRYL